jgi:hypothetical protein
MIPVWLTPLIDAVLTALGWAITLGIPLYYDHIGRNPSSWVVLALGALLAPRALAVHQAIGRGRVARSLEPDAKAALRIVALAQALGPGVLESTIRSLEQRRDPSRELPRGSE